MASKKVPTELQRLRAENQMLKQANAALTKQIQQAEAAPSLPVWRRFVVITLTLLAVLILTVGNLIFWAGNTIVKNDRFVTTTSPVIRDPAVQSAIAQYTTDQLFKQVNVEQYIEQALPPRAEFLAPNLSSQVKSQTESALKTGLQNHKFQQTWNQILARQHQRLINTAASYKGDGTISINDVYKQLSQQLESTKLSFLAGKQLPSKVGSITVIDAPLLPKFHNLVVNIDMWRSLAIGVLVACLTAAVWLSRNRRQTVYWFSLGVVVAMLTTLISLRFGQETIAGSVDAAYADAARNTFNIVTSGLVTQTWLLTAAAAVVAGIAWMSGQSKGATTIKEQVVMSASGAIHRQLFGTSTHPALVWVQRHKTVLQWSMVAIATLIVLMVRLTAGVLIGYILVVTILVLLIEILAAPGSERRVVKRRKR